MAPDIALSPVMLTLISAGCVILLAVVTAWRLARTVAEERAAVRKQREELVHASRLAIVGELTASLAHEINQPLGAILSNADAAELLLERDAPPLGEIRQILADIRRDGLRASGVIVQVRKLVRRRDIEFEVVESDDLVRSVVALLEPEARRRRLSLVHAPAEPPLHVLGDRTLLTQVLINLVMNAIDAAAAGAEPGAIPWGDAAARSRVLIAVSEDAEHDVEFRVADAGIGIPPERLDRLFDSFFTSKDHGMGLGLSIARSIVQAHGGRIHGSNNPGGGATFRFSLPRVAAPPAAEAGQAGTA